MRRLSTLLAALVAGSAATAQPAPPVPQAGAEETIVVTGRRDGGLLLSVDFQRVARQCAECRRVLARIEKLATPYQVKKRQIARDRTTMIESVQIHAHGGAPGAEGSPAGDARSNTPAGRTQAGRAARLMDRVPEHFRKDETELRTMRRDVSGLVAAFVAQLEPHVVAAAEEERRARGASAVVRMTRRATANRPQEVTDAVIRRLNGRQITITLPGL